MATDFWGQTLQIGDKDKNGNPIYLEFYGHGNFRPKQCKYVHRGGGWQFV